MFNWKHFNIINIQLRRSQKEKERLQFKINFLKEKKTCYKSYKAFLSRCRSEKIIPKQLRINLVPSIENLYEEFTGKWYEHLQVFSLSLMSEAISFCGKAIDASRKDILNKTKPLSKN